MQKSLTAKINKEMYIGNYEQKNNNRNADSAFIQSVFWLEDGARLKN